MSTSSAVPTAGDFSAHDFKVADLSLAAFGRKEISLAEHEMPGLMAMRAEYGETQAADRRPHHRVAAHDRADRGAHRDPRGPRRRGPLGLLQHLLHPGPRRRRHRGRPERHRRGPAGRPGLRLEGRDPRGVLVVHRAGAALAGRRRPQHDPRRRWRRHAARAQGPRVRARRRGARRRAADDSEEFAVVLALLRRSLAEDADALDHDRRRASGASPRRPPPASTASTRCARPARCCSRPSTSTTR